MHIKDALESVVLPAQYYRARRPSQVLLAGHFSRQALETKPQALSPTSVT